MIRFLVRSRGGGRPTPPEGRAIRVRRALTLCVSAPTAGEANDAAASLPAATVIPPELPKSEPQPQGPAKTPEVLSISDELREAIFPTQKVMVSVIFNETTPALITREPGRQHWSDDDPSAGDDSGRRHDFPII